MVDSCMDSMRPSDSAGDLHSEYGGAAAELPAEPEQEPVVAPEPAADVAELIGLSRAKEDAMRSDSAAVCAGRFASRVSQQPADGGLKLREKQHSPGWRLAQDSSDVATASESQPSVESGLKRSLRTSGISTSARTGASHGERFWQRFHDAELERRFRMSQAALLRPVRLSSTVHPRCSLMCQPPMSDLSSSSRPRAESMTMPASVCVFMLQSAKRTVMQASLSNTSMVSDACQALCRSFCRLMSFVTISTYIESHRRIARGPVQVDVIGSSMVTVAAVATGFVPAPLCSTAPMAWPLVVLSPGGRALLASRLPHQTCARVSHLSSAAPVGCVCDVTVRASLSCCLAATVAVQRFHVWMPWSL